MPDGEKKRIGVTRAHLEEDAGKSVHDQFGGDSGIDLNRAGTPLLEIVSEPDLRSAAEAIDYMRKVHAIVRFLGICDGNMQEGSFRCDANVSVRRGGQSEFGTRAEIKNLNSFRFVEKAINHEIERQIECLEQGLTIVQETRLYDSNTDTTRSMRSKEEANDYRYFPDPDLLPVEVTADDLATIRQTLPELPDAMRSRFETQYELTGYDANALTAGPDIATFFEETVRALGGEPKLVANWIMGAMSAALNTAHLSITQSPISPQRLAGLLARVVDKTISGNIARQVFETMWATDSDADAIIEREGLRQVTDTGALEALVAAVIAENPAQVQQYRDGKTKILGFLVGAVMKASQGKANPQQVNELLRSKLEG